jgi:hypothetical protein
MNAVLNLSNVRNLVEGTALGDINNNVMRRLDTVLGTRNKNLISGKFRESEVGQGGHWERTN